MTYEGEKRARTSIPARHGLASSSLRAGREEVNGMCVSCGCGVPRAAHGDDRHITLDDLEAAARAAGVTVEDVLRNIRESHLGPDFEPSYDPTTKG